jgi:hypothetical protein
LLANEVSNLMLMCHVHHKLIDVDERDKHPETRLHEMKDAHERTYSPGPVLRRGWRFVRVGPGFRTLTIQP